MTAVIYARYSSDSQREESIEGQLRECTAFAEKNGLAKRRYDLDLVTSKLDENAKTEAAFSILAMNAFRKLREHFLRLFPDGFFLALFLPILCSDLSP